MRDAFAMTTTEAARIAARPSVAEWLERTRRRPSSITRTQVLEALDETRGAWPDADHRPNDSENCHLLSQR